MKIAVIPDTQVKPGVNLDYLHHIGSYIAEKEPDVVVHLGDHWDMPSLSSYDVGKRQYEGRRYLADIDAGNQGFFKLNEPFIAKRARQRKNKEKVWNPRKVFLRGNHEQRVERAINSDAKLEGIMGYHDMDTLDWTVYDFLEVVEIEGIAFSHYFTTGVAGRPASTANAMLNKKHQSCIAGHQQGRQVATAYKANGEPITAIIAGSAYPHEEDYLGAQGNKHWRGIVMLYEAQNGSFDESFISLNYLKGRYK
jgi:hypothetical protein